MLGFITFYSEDERLHLSFGKVALRQARILRLLADLACVFGLSVRTVKRDIAALRRERREVRTRGTRRAGKLRSKGGV
jgi:predicted DNA-binding transcriptional regulator YafY